MKAGVVFKLMKFILNKKSHDPKCVLYELLVKHAFFLLSETAALPMEFDLLEKTETSKILGMIGMAVKRWICCMEFFPLEERSKESDIILDF